MKKLVVRRVRPEKLEELRAWGPILSGRREDVIASLVSENVQREFSYIVPFEDGHLWVSFMESDGDIKANKLSVESRSGKWEISPDTREFIAHIAQEIQRREIHVSRKLDS
jgi:hypothetical protein